MSSFIAVESVSFHPKGLAKAILFDVSFKVQSGESVAVVGPSGSGKSTLLSLFGGIEKPTYGRVFADYHGEPCDAQRLVSWIPQADTMLPRRSVLDNVLVVSNVRGRQRKVDRKVALGLLRELGLAVSPYVPLRRLSGGERQRVAICRAILGRSAFIFADEPTGQLDLSTSTSVANIILRCSADYGQGLLLATHDLLLAERCDRVVEVVDGRIHQSY